MKERELKYREAIEDFIHGRIGNWDYLQARRLYERERREAEGGKIEPQAAFRG